MVNIQGELLVMKTIGIRPNFAELGRISNMFKLCKNPNLGFLFLI